MQRSGAEGFAAPELLDNEAMVDPYAADVCSFGKVLMDVILAMDLIKSNEAGGSFAETFARFQVRSYKPSHAHAGTSVAEPLCPQMDVAASCLDHALCENSKSHGSKYDIVSLSAFDVESNQDALLEYCL